MNLTEKLLRSTKSKCLIDGGDKFTFDQLMQSALKIGQGLKNEFEIKPAERVCLIAHNSSEFLIAYLAVLSIGAVCVPLDPYAKESELAHDISLVRPKLFIVNSAEIVPEIFRDKIQLLEFHSSQWRKFSKGKKCEIEPRSDGDIALMLMTSSSSFQSRPAMLTHGSLISNIEQAMSVEELKLSQKDKVLAALPMYHIFGLHVVAGLSLASEACLVICRTLDSTELAHEIRSQKITIVPGVPALFDSFVRNKDVTIDAFSSVRMFISGGAPMRSELRNKFKEKFGSDVYEGYGLTEASPMVSFSSNAKREGDIGNPLKGVEVEIRDNSGEVALDGDVGQIVIRGKNVFAGYFGDSESTNKVLDKDGWLFTGDVGVKNDDGSITLIDRSNDVIVVHGFSVYPSEVENVLLESELVDQVSVSGELDEDSGEAVVAFVSVASSFESVTDPKVKRQIEKDLREHCLAKLSRYKVPTKFEFLDELNVKASSRPLRKSLRSAIRNFE